MTDGRFAPEGRVSLLPMSYKLIFLEIIVLSFGPQGSNSGSILDLYKLSFEIDCTPLHDGCKSLVVDFMPLRVDVRSLEVFF